MSFLFSTLLIFLLFLHKELLNSPVVEWYSNVEMRNEQNYKDWEAGRSVGGMVRGRVEEG